MKSNDEMDRIEGAVIDARAALAAGANLGEVVRAFREDHELGPVAACFALKKVMNLRHALPLTKELVFTSCHEGTFNHLLLADLRQLAEAPDGETQRWLHDAILRRLPWLLFTPDPNGRVVLFSGLPEPGPMPERAGSIGGRDKVSLEPIAAKFRVDAQDPRWADDLEIVRDEPEAVLLLRFPRVRA